MVIVKGGNKDPIACSRGIIVPTSSCAVGIQDAFRGGDIALPFEVYYLTYYTETEMQISKRKSRFCNAIVAEHVRPIYSATTGGN